MSPSLRAILSLAVLLTSVLGAFSSPPIIREPDAIYLSDFGQKPLSLKLLRPANSYFDTAMTRYAGTLRFPQVVKVEAFTPTVCRIRGNAQQGGVAAWIPYADLEGLPPGFLGTLQKADERRKTVESLIAKNEVALGMTVDEVSRSLGKPQKKSSRADKDGLVQVYEYIKYDLVPQTVYGPGTTQTVIPNPQDPKNPQVVTQTGYTSNTIYVKVPVGTLKVSFKDGLVDSLDQSEGTLAGAQPTIVAPPINIVW